MKQIVVILVDKHSKVEVDGVILSSSKHNVVEKNSKVKDLLNKGILKFIRNVEELTEKPTDAKKLIQEADPVKETKPVESTTKKEKTTRTRSKRTKK